jgi:hypothetical protein
LALAPVRKRRVDQVTVVDGTPRSHTRDHRVADPSKNYRYSVNLQVAIDADPALSSLPVTRNQAIAMTARSIASPASTSNSQVGRWSRTAATTASLRWSSRTVHRRVRARIEHATGQMKTWKILRNYRRSAHTLASTASGIAPAQHRLRQEATPTMVTSKQQDQLLDDP